LRTEHRQTRRCIDGSFRVQILFLDVQLQELENTLLSCAGANMLCDLTPVVIETLESFEEPQNLGICPRSVAIEGRRVSRVFHLHIHVTVMVGRQPALRKAVRAEVVLGLGVGICVVAVVVYPSAVVAALMTMNLGDRSLSGILRTGHAIGSWCFAVGFALGLADKSALGVGLIDVSSNLEVLISFGRGSCSSLLVGILVLLTL
jgi:hypothetical protein